MILTPKPGVDVTPRSKSDPRPLYHCCSRKKEPQMIFTWSFIQHVKLRMMYTDDARIASSNFIHHHEPQVWETSGRKLGTLTNHRYVRTTLQNLKNLDPQAIGQWAAHNIYLSLESFLLLLLDLYLYFCCFWMIVSFENPLLHLPIYHLSCLVV